MPGEPVPSSPSWGWIDAGGSLICLVVVSAPAPDSHFLIKFVDLSVCSVLILVLVLVGLLLVASEDVLVEAAAGVGAAVLLRLEKIITGSGGGRVMGGGECWLVISPRAGC